MKSVLMSIKAIHNHNIESGLKKAELRTKAPNLEPPFKVYTYESGSDGRHKVVNEWVCNNIRTWRMCMGIPAHLSIVACVSNEYIWDYCARGKKEICEMQISDLKIYDKPKDLSEFKRAGYLTEDEWLAYLYPNTHCHYDAWVKNFNIDGPPQNWCYVKNL